MGTASMAPGRRLLVRPRPEKGESLLGYLSRLGELNGLVDIKWEASLTTGIHLGEISHETLTKLGSAIGLAPEELAELSYRSQPRPSSGKWLFMGRSFWYNDFRIGRSVVCTECLSEHHAAPAIWDLRLICACVRHQQWLIDSCPSCHTRLGWRRRSLLRCRCHYDLRRRDTPRFRPSKAVLAFTQALEDALRGDLSVGSTALGYEKDPIVFALVVFERAKRYVVNYPSEAEQVLPLSTSQHRLDMQSVACLAPVVINWPDALNAMLHRLISDPDRHVWGMFNSVDFRLRFTEAEIRVFRSIMGGKCVSDVIRIFLQQHPVQARG